MTCNICGQLISDCECETLLFDDITELNCNICGQLITKCNCKHLLFVERDPKCELNPASIKNTEDFLHFLQFMWMPGLKNMCGPIE